MFRMPTGLLIAALMMGLVPSSAKADLLFDIESLTTSPTGGSFAVTATPVGLPAPPNPLNLYTSTLSFSGFSGIAQLTNVTFANVLGGFAINTLLGGSTPQPATVNPGGSIRVEGFGSGSLPAGTTTLFQVNYTTTGFEGSDEFQVAFVPDAGLGNFETSAYNLIDPYAVTFGASNGITTIAAVPEASSFLYLGIASVLGVAYRKLRSQAAV